jgi:hypothetical protein
MRVLAGIAALVVLALPSSTHAAPPTSGDSTSAEAIDTGGLEGRVRAASRRMPLADVKLLIVAAPADAKPGRPARDVLDPSRVTWVREAWTDEQGRFAIDELPIGKVRVVILASGHARTEIYAEVTRGRSDALELFVEPDEGAGFRTEVISERPKEHVEDAEPEHRIDAKQARVYPGSGGDPLRAAQNLPGVARSPAGLGMVAIRGGDPRQTGVYLDGHPIPRGFHVLPIASVVSPGMTESVELTPGNYDAAFGGHSAGLLQIHTRPGDRERAIHGEAHLDLFDFGARIAGPVGPGGLTFGFRRAHVGNVIETVDKILPEGLGILIPNYWDYLGRFDMPLGKHHRLTVRALGAGDSIRDDTIYYGSPTGTSRGLAFTAGFHRIDFAHEFERGRWRTSISPALRLDASDLAYGSAASIGRHAWVISLRASASYRLSHRATLIAGLDLVDDHWRRREAHSSRDPVTFQPATQTTDTHGRDLALGTWLGVALRFKPKPGPLIVRMQVRLNVFSDGREARVMPDPRVDLRFRVHPRVELFGALGQYSFPQIVQRGEQANFFNSGERLPGVNGVLDIPIWLLTYFDPGIEGEVVDGSMLLGRTLQASTGVQVELPWDLGMRATGFWRETGAQSRTFQFEDFGYFEAGFLQARAYGLELLLDRALARDIHGWIGYSLLQSRNHRPELGKWQPTEFDQRHNLVALVSVGLPHGFRFGVRFRLVSGNPDRPIYGASLHRDPFATGYRPIRGDLGDTYRPTFHQLDLRFDKTWPAKRAAVTAYIDIQNVYNLRYPELWMYTLDYRERSERIGLPIFPSLGLRVEY